MQHLIAINNKVFLHQIAPSWCYHYEPEPLLLLDIKEPGVNINAKQYANILKLLRVNINAKQYANTLKLLRVNMKNKRPMKLTNDVFLLHDSTPQHVAHTVQDLHSRMDLEVCQRAPYTPDLFLCDLVH